MEEQKKKDILKKIHYVLLMMIFTSILIGTTILWDARIIDKNESSVMTVDDVKRVKRAQLYKYKAESIVFDGDDVNIGGR